jgi:hypothetical protein
MQAHKQRVKWAMGWMLSLCMLLSCAGAGAASGALSATQLAGADAALVVESITVAQNAPADLKIDQLSLPAAKLAFAPFNPDIVYGTQLAPLWLHLRVRAPQDLAAGAWSVHVSKPYIDRVELYTRSPPAGWQMQAAGDWMAHQDWPVRSLNPEFALPAMSAGSHDVYLRVFNLLPLHFGVQLMPTEEAQLATERTLRRAAVLLGVFVLMIVVSTILAVVYRHPAFAWYALYALVVLVGSMSFMGVASRYLWPHSTWWPEGSTTVLTVLAMMVQLQFCRVVFIARSHKKWIFKASTAVLIACAVGLVAYVALPHTFALLHEVIAVLMMFACMAAMLALVTYDLVHRPTAMAWLWMLGYAPLLVLIVLAIVENFGWMAMPWMPYQTPLLGLLWEMPLLLLALHLFAKAQHMHQVRDQTLAMADPLGLYIDASRFGPAMRKLWVDTTHQAQDIAVVYVQIEHDPEHLAHLGQPDPQRSLLRSVRLLRMVMRDNDTLAHAAPNVLAIIMPDIALDENFTHRLSRLVALARMTDADASHDVPLRFKVVASSKRSFTGNWDALDAAMHAKLQQATGWSRRAIRYVGQRSTSQPSASQRRLADAEELSQLWERALQESARLNQPVS